MCFFNEICNQLIAALNESFPVGQLSTSQSQATITLIEKKAKDKRFLKNWRPISLINVDAKIASKVLASRMKNILSSIVKCDQTAYVKGRYIGESIRLISDILEYAEENDISGILFSADFEKSFDSIEHALLFAVLESFGFGPQFIQWVRTFLNPLRAAVEKSRQYGTSSSHGRRENSTEKHQPVSEGISWEPSTLSSHTAPQKIVKKNKLSSD